MSPLSPRQYLSCHAGSSLVAPPPLLLRRSLSCGASLAPAGCCFTNYLDVPPSLLSRRLGVACYLSLCSAVSHFATSLSAPPSLWVVYPLNPSKECIGLLGESNTINLTQRHGTNGLMWGARGQFLPAAAMVVMFVLGRWFTSAHIYFRNSTYFLQNKTVLGLNFLDRLKFRNHVPPPCLNFRLFLIS